jgi:hypothetical protein
MVEILAAVNWEDIILVGSAMGIFQGTKMLMPKKKANGYNQRLCDEKHRIIDERHQEIRDSFRNVFTKLDKIQEHLLK